jgi:7-cyano-7-deazaguanine synthase
LSVGSDTGRPRTLILTSGGIDSACLLALSAAEDAEALFVDYGHLARMPEERAAAAVASNYRVPLSRLHVGPLSAGEGEIPGRNTLLAHLALSALAGSPGRVLIGIHAGTGYRDCSPEFAELVQRSYDFHSDGRVQFTAPFIEQTKREILVLAGELGVPVELTYSCERGTEPPCGGCRSCRDRKGLRAAA